jgi:hypothetical protein
MSGTAIPVQLRHCGVLYDGHVTRAKREENSLEPRPLAADHRDRQRAEGLHGVHVPHGRPPELEAVEVAEPGAHGGALR